MHEMKDSGVAWIGQIPKNWLIERLQWHVDEVKESNKPIKTTRILSLTNKTGVIPYEDKGEQGNKAKENYEEYNIAYPNTIVANSMNILIGSVGICDYFGCVSPIYYVYKPKKNENLHFINYIFQMQQFQKELRRYANGILEIRLRLSSSNILKRHIAFPPLQEQQIISNYLDKKCSLVDTLIYKQNQQIEKLKWYKQSLITEVITKGLNSNAMMKDSGVEWIGEISNDLTVIPLKFLLSEPMMYGANESGQKEKIDNCLRYIRITDIDSEGKLKDSEDNQYLSYEIGNPYILEEGDILFARSGGTVGKTFLFHTNYGQSAFAGYLIKAKCNIKKIIPNYLLYFTQSSLYEVWKNMIFIQATIQNIGANKYSNMEIVLPSIMEQKQIVKYLDAKCEKIDKLIDLKQRKIEKLQDYKKSLIYEYVTGKKEVTA